MKFCFQVHIYHKVGYISELHHWLNEFIFKNFKYRINKMKFLYILLYTNKLSLNHLYV